VYPLTVPALNGTVGSSPFGPLFSELGTPQENR